MIRCAAARRPKKVEKSQKKLKKVIDLLPERAYLVSIERVIGTHYIIGLQKREVRKEAKKVVDSITHIQL